MDSFQIYLNKAVSSIGLLEPRDFSSRNSLISGSSLVRLHHAISNASEEIILLVANSCGLISILRRIAPRKIPF